MKNDLRGVGIGDWIWTIRGGWVKVKRIYNDAYPIVTIDDSYSLDGKKLDSDKYPSAFTEPPECFNAEPKPCEFEKGQKVLVWDNNETKRRRYFSHKENGMYFCFICDETYPWHNCIAWEEGND